MVPDSISLATVDETVRRRFECDWRAGRPEAIEVYLPAPDHPHYQTTLEELVHIELELAWKAGAAAKAAWKELPRVESYLKRFPPMNQPVLLLRLLRQEYRVRHLYGDRPSVGEYQQGFPLLVVSGAEVATALPDQPVPTEGLPTGPGDEEATLPGGNPGPLQIPGYEILEEIGRGGMGVVYKARQQTLKRLVALKVLATGALAGPDERARFRREAEAAAGLQHPNVVQIYEIGEHQGWPYLAMELVNGSLAGRIAGRPQPARAAAELIETLARAMHCSHQRGVVHRDLKPANILQTEDGTPKITDFGLARQLASDSGATRTGDMLGTPSYMAPEQAEGQARKAGPAADVYSLGAILYELLTGSPPFRAETALKTAAQVLFQEPVPPRRRQPKVPGDLETICLKCLRKKPAQRYASAAALADDLRRFLTGQPIEARPARWGERLLMACRRWPAAAALAGLGIALLVALGLLLAPNRSGDSVAGKPPAPQPPSFAWDFEAGMPSHSTHQGTEFTHANLFGQPPYTDSLILRFRMAGFSMLQVPFTLPDDALAPQGRPAGRWMLEIYHRNTTKNKDGTGLDYSPARVSLNGQKVWEGNPDGPEEAQVPGGVRWKHLERDVSDLVRPGENMLRWDHLSGAATNYWLKSFRIFWQPASP